MKLLNFGFYDTLNIVYGSFQQLLLKNVAAMVCSGFDWRCDVGRKDQCVSGRTDYLQKMYSNTDRSGTLCIQGEGPTLLLVDVQVSPRLLVCADLSSRLDGILVLQGSPASGRHVDFVEIPVILARRWPMG